ncbi:uncharacterized protein B0I36DRAFT_352490 [Microdochium trichocladiopsis]|uniref:Uncharacterized protein n=1 Tax=Microdochium trichocladiopsis TaxID=1682393 RepID=A0A9P8Y251_9PEZI|nr:uncharacterized protein B0I36DRAFT_352490 [Microdochium trichocladiopsis]KAH7026656.1 hypothetical protein B0I36DRAFT_352490 [Microdochium trichocladiopsis]
MLFTKSAILACLAATASAVELRFYVDGRQGCQGSYTFCPNLPTGQCCTTPNVQDVNTALGWYRLRPSTGIRGVGYFQERCGGDEAGSGTSNGQSSMCYPTPQYRSGKFSTLSGARETTEDAVHEEQGIEGSCRKPGGIVYEDGTEFDLTGLSDEQNDEM